MQFEWKLLGPNQDLPEAQRSLVREVGETFLKTGSGIPYQQKRIELGKNRRLLDGLAQLQLIRNISNKYFPSFAALYYLTPEQRNYCLEATDCVFRASQSLYKKQIQQAFALRQIEQEANLVTAGAVSEKTVRTGLLFALDFQNYFSNPNYSENAPVVNAFVSENILDYESLQQAWLDEINVRPRPNLVSPSPREERKDSKVTTDTSATASQEDPSDSKPNHKQSRQTIEAQDSLGEHPKASVTGIAINHLAEEQFAESIDTSSISDTPTRKDSLGFKPYVEAISKFLLSPDTDPPLALSIEGEWGSGKSSFMLQLGDTLKRESLKERIHSFSVRFNPWRHDKEDSLWAAFALEFLRQMRGQRFLLRRWWGDLRLFWAHYCWKSGWFEMLRAVAVWLALGILVIGSIEVVRYKPRWAEEMLVALSNRLNSPQAKTSVPKNGELPDATEGLPPQEEKGKQEEKGEASFDPILRVLLLVGGNAAYFAVVLTIWLKLKDVVGNPLEINLKKYLRSPDYEGRVAFVEQFHADFKKIVDAYAGKEKAFVFMDDLDRCEVPKAAELMKAVNLLIADDPRLIFILGMDRDKVAAGLAVKYEKILPYLSPESQATSNESQANWRVGLHFGPVGLESRRARHVAPALFKKRHRESGVTIAR